jgi:4-alpha-glucanotransferase
MNFGRVSGILLHPTSLPGPYGIGELGSEAYRFADFLADSAQTIWQVLPLGPTGYGNSPYQSPSSFAGNPLLISIENLLERGWLEPSDLEGMPTFPEDSVEFEALIPWKLGVLKRAFQRFQERATPEQREHLQAFRQVEGPWLDNYALFMALSEEQAPRPWYEWEEGLAKRVPEALSVANERLQDTVEMHLFWQYVFFEQWRALKRYCNGKGIRLMGDIPIYVAHESADVWADPQYFHLDESGRPSLVAGVPPDYFSATGQLWGHPIYRWEAIAESRYEWWVNRIRACKTNFDLVRIDHFRGFEAYWEVPGDEETAINGRWVAGPGRELFDAVRAQLGDFPIVAENLGIITVEVEALRKSLGFPGMAVLQFAFGVDRTAPGLLPHSYTPDTVAYTGTHDNDTIMGWWNSTGEGTTTPIDVLQAERRLARKYLGTTGLGAHWDAIRAVLASVADTAIVPLQDVLGLGSEARMNQPGIAEGNWQWRFREDMITGEHEHLLRSMTTLFGRAPGRVPADAL